MPVLERRGAGRGRAVSQVGAVGRGRAASRGREQVVATSDFWSTRQSVESSNNVETVNDHDIMREKMIRIAEKYSNMESDESSEEELNESEILQLSVKISKQYQDVLQDDKENIDNQFLTDVLRSGGAVTCLVCIESVKRLDAIWSCNQCCCIFHLQCIQKWSKESVGRQALNCDGDLTLLNPLWNCPKCRYEYKQTECPTKYICFCGKEENPPFDPWIVPHSCGQQCEQKLKPLCGHECLLLCHPGPCPPCPKTVTIKCYCGREGPAFKRCSTKGWSCKRRCDKQLSCAHHLCQEFCHKGDCPPCPNKSEQACLCGNKKTVRECVNPEWSCEQMCRKDLSCDHHVCEKICHSGVCGECPRSGKRTCPCGKTNSMLPCTEDIPSCEDTCLKDLTCGIHKCSKRCHYGSCDTCLQVREKTCRCGRRNKEVPCSQPLMCDIKCTNVRSCGRHPCKKKCCDGNCPPCEQICNRSLNCQNHKCPSPCHTGPCYPCPLSKKVTCFCGVSSFTVPCGREKVSKPPRCKQKCKLPPDCHHASRASHNCHFGRCPPCNYKCDKEISLCKHACQEVCHDHIFDKKATDQNKLRSTSKKAVNDVFISLPCSPCQFPVEKLCFGEHVNESFPCCDVKVYSCKRACGRLLTCENHTCQRECHVVKGHPPEGVAGRNCIQCEEICLTPRPKGCVHDCKLPCHPGECSECNVHLKLPCHCKTIQVYVKCSEYNAADKRTKDDLLCCKARCPKLLSCDHLCAKYCHKDECSQADKCVERTKIKCPCGRKKKDFSCQEERSGMAKVECDDRCKEIKEKKKQEKLQRVESEKAEEIKKQQQELEKFERKKQGRKRKQRQYTESEDNETIWERYKIIIILCILIIPITIAVFATYALQ